MAEEVFKLPGSSYDELCNIIKGYSQISDTASLKEVSTLVKMHETTISRNSGFLLEMGVVEGGSKKGPTSIGRQLGLALMHEESDEVRKFWADLIEESSFMNKILSAVRIRNGMSQSNLQSHIAYSAGQKKSANVVTGAGTVISILRASGHLIEQDGFLTSASMARSAHPALPNDTANDDSRIAATVPENLVASHTIVTRHGAPVSLSISVEVACSVDELSGLGEKLAEVMRQFAEAQNSSSSEDN